MAESFTYPLREGVETDHVFSLVYTPSDGLLWIGHETGLAVFRPPTASSYAHASATNRPLEDRAIARAAAGSLALQAGAGRAASRARRRGLLRDAGLSRHALCCGSPSLAIGGMWIMTGRTFFTYASGRFSAVEDPRLRATLAGVGEDSEGNLWLATQAAGLIRMARSGFRPSASLMGQVRL